MKNCTQGGARALVFFTVGIEKKVADGARPRFYVSTIAESAIAVKHAVSFAILHHPTL